jgi:hypothetical protein
MMSRIQDLKWQTALRQDQMMSRIQNARENAGVTVTQMRGLARFVTGTQLDAAKQSYFVFANVMTAGAATIENSAYRLNTATKLSSSRFYGLDRLKGMESKYLLEPTEKNLALAKHWDRGTFATPLESASYHWSKHGFTRGQTFEEYTQNAVSFWKERKLSIGEGKLADSISFKGSTGGAFRSSGEILTFRNYTKPDMFWPKVK